MTIPETPPRGYAHGHAFTVPFDAEADLECYIVDKNGTVLFAIDKSDISGSYYAEVKISEDRTKDLALNEARAVLKHDDVVIGDIKLVCTRPYDGVSGAPE